MLVKNVLRASILMVLMMAFQATQTLAGSTGTINGTVSVSDGTPLQGAHVTVTSPSQTSTAVTDSHGHYAFLSLAPDTYKVTASKEGYESVQQVGITVTADQTQAVNLTTSKSVSTIGKVTVVGSSTALVSKSQVANIYSVSAQQLTAVQAAGGGNNLENAYSAIDTVPGIYHFLSNAGWGQTLFIHGGNYTEVGYEYDGVPVNRAFDQYNGDTLSSLGNQQLQVYTGGAPASSASSTVSGFINQVIKTGTYPGFATASFAAGSPGLWNGAKFEIGGGAPDRLFTYYAGVSTYGQGLRVLDQFNGGLYNGPFTNPSIYPTFNPLGPSPFFFGYAEGTIPYCNPDGSYPIPNPNTDAGCYQRGIPQNMNLGIGVGQSPAQINDHEGVVNLHFGVPHPHDGNRDDIQALYSGSFLLQRYYSSTADAGGIDTTTRLTDGFLGGPPAWADGYAFPDGTTFGSTVNFAAGGGNNNSNLNYIRYLFPSSPTNRAPDSALPVNQRDGETISDEIGKLQYTHNMGSNAYLRFFGYSLYSNWLQNAPNSTIYYYQIGLGQLGNFIASPDYELSTHTYGGEIQLSDQLNDKNLLNFTLNYATAHSLRYNNKEMLNTFNSHATVLADANGNCYSIDATTDPNTGLPIAAGAPTYCDLSHAQGSFGNPTRSGLPITGAAAAAGADWKVAALGPTGTYNTVRPNFGSGGLSDQFRMSDKFLLNGGIRFENYKYTLTNADTPDNNFWFHAAAQEYCYDPATGQPARVPIPPSVTPPAPPFTGLTCPASPVTGLPTVHPDGLSGHLLFTNHFDPNINHSEWLPRLGGTYTINDNSVLRFNYGRYAQPVETAFTEYLYAPGAGHSAAAFNFVNFWGLGFTTPRHDLPPVTSNNYDFSYEQRLPKSTVAFRLTPFFRSSQGEYGTISLGPNFASGFPYANEQVQGLEFQTQAGNPNINGFSGQFSFTYTHATVKLIDTPTGQNSIDILNGYIDGFNALTASGNVQGVKGAPCYNMTEVSPTNPFGAAAPGECTISGSSITLGPGATGSTVINPYYFDPRQADLDRNGSYQPYQTFPSNPIDVNTSNLWPYLFSGYVTYKHDKISITPTFALQSGSSYGGPTDIIGYDPRTCQQNQGPLGAGVPDGNPGKANFVSCGSSLVNGGVLAIPNPTTGSFDSVGQYNEPWVLNINAQIAADISPTVTARLVMANILNTCFGGTSTPWSKAFAPGTQTCFYGANGLAVSNFWNGTGPNDPVGNVGSPIPQYSFPYQPEPYGGGFNPFQMTFQLQFHL